MTDQPYRRQIFLRANCFQKPIIYLILYPSLFTSIILFLYILFFQYEVIKTVYAPESTNIQVLGLKTALVFFFLILSFMAVVAWAYKISSNLVGAFERIMREMDDILAGKGKHHIRVRKDDELANELLKRVNALIDKLP